MVQYAVIATPIYDGRLHDACAVAISEARLECIKASIFPNWIVKSDSPYLPVVRNLLVRDFLAIPQATDLVFIDADVGFDPTALPRLLQHDADIVGGAYPFKSDGGGFPVMLDEEDGMPRVDERTGLPLCHFLPTGFLRIRRSVFERWRLHFGDTPEVVVYENGEEIERYFPFFETPVENGRFWGEDVLFCRRWREELGGVLLLDPDISFTHVGRKHWHGNYHYYRRHLAGGDLAHPAEGSGLDHAPMYAAQPVKGAGMAAQIRTAVARAREGLPELLEQAERLVTKPAEAEAKGNGNGSAATVAPAYEPGPELLLGCGASRFKSLLAPGSTPDWHDLTTLDRNPDAAPDVVFDLESGPLPFPDDTFAEIHAYEVLEHIGQQGDWRAFFRQFGDYWRVLRPGGYLIGSVPAWDSEAAWGDPSHRRVLPPMVFSYLSQEQYRQQIGQTMMADFRGDYHADFELVHVGMEPARYAVDLATGRVKRMDPVEGRFTHFILRAIKPSTWSATDLERVAQHQAQRAAEYEQRKGQWRREHGLEARP